MAHLAPLSLLAYPYQALTPMTEGRKQIRAHAATPGSALVWDLNQDPGRRLKSLVERRPGGVALIAILPDAEKISKDPFLVSSVQRCRPHGLLPTHEDPSVADLRAVLRRPAIDLAREVTDYLAWRGIVVDRDTGHLLRQIVDLSSELRSITALCRRLYLSRRALGRRLTTRGLPVPSHWLQMSRVLRLAFRLQNSEASIFTIAYESGYPDGFAVSNQMHRLVGYRPSQVREFLGWEWIFESWLRREADDGKLDPNRADEILAGPKANEMAPAPISNTRARRLRQRRSRA